MMVITPYRDKYLSHIIELILSIQQKEFNIPVTLEAQPDLQKIPEIYQTGKGNFWIALKDEQPVGTIGLIDIGENTGVIRKMFVNAAYRGKVTWSISSASSNIAAMGSAERNEEPVPRNS